ncbi:hypothetical protein AB0F45_38480, partial [Streptomyces achromogenes]
MTSTSTPTERTGSGLGLLAVLMPAILATVTASDMVNLMLPTIGSEFGASEAELAWVVTGFLLMFSVARMRPLSTAQASVAITRR